MSRSQYPMPERIELVYRPRREMSERDWREYGASLRTERGGYVQPSRPLLDPLCDPLCPCQCDNPQWCGCT